MVKKNKFKPFGISEGMEEAYRKIAKRYKIDNPLTDAIRKRIYQIEKQLYKRQRLNEDPSMWSAIGGIMGLLGTASIVASLEMMSEDPAMQEKYPKATDALRKIFGFLGKVGGDMASGMGKGVGFKEGKENKGMGYREYLKKEIEGDKEEKEDVEETKEK